MYRFLPVFLILTWSLPATGQDLVISNVTVVDVTDGSLSHGQTVVIEGNRINSISPTNYQNTPTGKNVVDGSGRYLIPGLWDMHVHTFNNNAPQPPNTWSFPLHLANGVTGVRDMWVKPGEQAEQVRAWSQELDAGTFVGPRFGAIGTLVDGVPRIQKSDTVTTVAEAKVFVTSLAEAGIDFVKPYSNLAPEVYHALVEAANESGLDVAGHSPNAMSSFEVAASGQRSIEHLTSVHETCSTQEDSLRANGLQAFRSPGVVVATFDPGKCQNVYRAFADNETWQVPTLITNRVWAANTTLQDLRQDEGILYSPAAEVAEWEWVASFLMYTPEPSRKAYDDLHKLERRIIGDMHKAGVPLLAGTDVGNPYIYPGFSLLDELGEFVASGLTPLEALQTATVNPARYLNRTDELGTVETGKLADLVVLDANPLENIDNVREIHAVIMNGRLFSQDDLAQMKHEVIASHYRDVLAQPSPLSVQNVDPEVLNSFSGAYQYTESERKAEVTVDDNHLLVSFGNWTDRLEPLGGPIFRVQDSNVLYIFYKNDDDSVWGFGFTDDDEVISYRRVNP